MRVIIIGLGQTGTMLADMASKEGHDVIVVDSRRELIDKVTDLYSVSGVCGNGATKATLLKAGADTADVVIAMTPVDEVNLMISIIAKSCGAIYTAARVHLPEISCEEEYLKEEFKLDCIINSRMETALEIARLLKLPGSVKADAFFGEDAAMLKIIVTKENKLADAPVKNVRARFNGNILIGCLIRDGKLIVPDGRFTLKENDVIDAVVASGEIEKIMVELGASRRTVKKVMVIGGGTTGMYLAKELTAAGKLVTMIENSPERCRYLSEQIPKAIVSYADGTDTEEFLKEKISGNDAVVALTGEDEKNLVTSLFAWSHGVGRVITKVNTSSYEGLLNKANIQLTISPATISTDRFLSFIKNVAVYNDEGNDIQGLYQIADGKAEAIEFIVYDNFVKKNVAIGAKEFTLKKDVMIAVIIRDGRFIIPDEKSMIRPGDHVVVIARANNGLNTINQIFR
ncbi:MAG: Trk system potassium transporter TrkA [Lachnospiraceae bacterium]|nr:Trk system potassium transporter TrkA [Lachnospiraceae bacterium]